MGKVGCLISACYSSRVTDPSDWPTPGINSATVAWPTTLPALTVQEIDAACNLLVELAGSCSLALTCAHGMRPVEEFGSYVERVQTIYGNNRPMLRDAACVAERAKSTSAEEQCADVTMPTMHAAVLQKACNIAGWQSSFDTIDNFRRDCTRAPQPTRLHVPDPSQLVNLSVVLLRLRGEAALARQYLSAREHKTDEQASTTLFSINIACVCESLESLAGDVEYIATGKADDQRDHDAWEHRTNAGLQLVRLRAALNNGALDRADCDLATLTILRRVWHSLERVRYGSHHDQPDKYRGPFFFPHEVGPLDEGLPLRTADERYDRYEELRPKVEKGAAIDGLCQLEQKPGDEIPDRTIELADRALRRINKPHLTTKRAEWSDFPNELRKLSAKLNRRIDQRAAQPKATIETPQQHPAIVRMQERDAWCFDQKRDGITLDQIVANLVAEAPKRKWRKLTRGGVRKAIQRHSQDIGATLPKGRGGRPRKSTK